LMFHHFFGGAHPNGQGAITAEQFAKILEYAGPTRILSPDLWLEKLEAGRLSPHDLCLTFDDALKCQMDIALPVLEAYNLKAFWFVYSGIFQGSADNLEIYRHYRTVAFSDVDAFYDAFFECFKKQYGADQFQLTISDFENTNHLREFSYYTDNDRLFRYIRDLVLKQEKYYRLMDTMIDNDDTYSRANASETLWLTEPDLQLLHQRGHEIGLHSYSHPTLLSALPENMQRREYESNAQHLEALLGSNRKSMAHPCGSYDRRTLTILRELGVKAGFNSSMTVSNDPLSIPRQDHSYMAMALGLR
jgi:peptidoglycan/xylan/chitin deacetylase (PgdA/CDA1 family)